MILIIIIITIIIMMNDDPHLVCAHAAVVRALGSGEAILGPSEGVTILVQQSVLLNIGQ